MTANDEFAAEVTRLYEEEEMQRQERMTLETEINNINDTIKKLEEDKMRWSEERQRLEDQEQRLLESVKMLSSDNANLIKEREEDQLLQSKTHQVVLRSSNSE